MRLQVLIVEPEPQDLLFLEEVLVEIEDARHWNGWLDLETQGATSCAEAVAILERDAVDIVLLNPDLGDPPATATFRRITAAAPHVPVVLLMDSTDPDLAAQLLREGAQDFLFKKQVECAPLAHAMRNAIERQRVVEAIRSTTMTDPLTGLLNRGAFCSLAERDRRLAQSLGRRMLFILAAPKDLPVLTTLAGDQARELAIVKTGETLRGLAGDTGLVGRLDATRFVLALFDTEDEPVESAWSRIHAAAAGARIAIGSAIFEPDAPAALEVLLERASSDLAALPLTAHAAAVRR